MAIFVREKTTELGDSYKDVDLFCYSGRRQTAAQNRRRKKHAESSPAQKNLNDEHAKRYCMQLIKTNFFHGDIHMTVTYDDLHIPESRAAADRHVRNFIRRVKYYLASVDYDVKNFKYLVITSVYSSDGEPARVHHHIIMSKIKDRDAIESLWHFGAANADRIRDFYNSINKLSGYIAKQTGGEKRWFSSKNLDKPMSRNVDGSKYTPDQLRRIAEYKAFDPSYWEKKYPGWTIVDRDYDIKVSYNETSGAYIRLQLKRKEAA